MAKLTETTIVKPLLSQRLDMVQKTKGRMVFLKLSLRPYGGGPSSFQKWRRPKTKMWRESEP
jgi:hypothetical protein